MPTRQPTPRAAATSATMAPPAPAYPIIKYRPIPGYPGFTSQKVNSAAEEAALTNPTGDAASVEGEIQWYDTPTEAQLARSAAHRPFEEYGQEIWAPIGVPVSLRPQIAAELAGAQIGRALPDSEPAYPLLKYQASDKPPGFRYVKVMNPADEATLEASGAGTWYDTPAEAIANPPARLRTPPPPPPPDQPPASTAASQASTMPPPPDPPQAKPAEVKKPGDGDGGKPK
jgi:hypothetical protein